MSLSLFEEGLSPQQGNMFRQMAVTKRWRAVHLVTPSLADFVQVICRHLQANTFPERPKLLILVPNVISASLWIRHIQEFGNYLGPQVSVKNIIEDSLVSSKPTTDITLFVVESDVLQAALCASNPGFDGVWYSKKCDVGSVIVGSSYAVVSDHDQMSSRISLQRIQVSFSDVERETYQTIRSDFMRRKRQRVSSRGKQVLYRLCATGSHVDGWNGALPGTVPGSLPEDAQCCICLESTVNNSYVVTSCKHLYCQYCALRHFVPPNEWDLDIPPKKCATCRNPIGIGDLFMTHSPTGVIFPFGTLLGSKWMRFMRWLQELPVRQPRLGHHRVLLVSQYDELFEALELIIQSNQQWVTLQWEDARPTEPPIHEVICCRAKQQVKFFETSPIVKSLTHIVSLEPGELHPGSGEADSIPVSCLLYEDSIETKAED